MTNSILKRYVVAILLKSCVFLPRLGLETNLEIITPSSRHNSSLLSKHKPIEFHNELAC